MLALRLAARVASQRQRAPVIVIVGGWLLASTVLLGAYPGESLDIFDYLNAWLGGSMAADFDGVNGLQQEDIFVFLNVWFTGC